MDWSCTDTKHVRGSFQPETSSRSITLSNDSDSESAQHMRAARLNRIVRGMRVTDVRPACRPVLVTALPRGAHRGIRCAGDGLAARGFRHF